MDIAVSTIVMILILALMVFFVFRGYKKGFLRLAITTFSFVIVIILATSLATPVSNLLENTAIGTKVESSVSDLVESKTEEYLDGVQGSISSEDESSFIESLPLPSYIQNVLISGNTAEEYAQMQIETFEEYITAEVTEVILSAIAYVIVMIIASILLRVILRLAKFVNKIPIIGGLNKILGALLGFCQALLIIWAIGLLIIAFSSTSIGSSAIAIIQNNAVLDFLFDNNLLIVIFGQLF